MNENNELGAGPLANEGTKGLPVVAEPILATVFYHWIEEDQDYDIHDAAAMSGDCPGCIPAYVVTRSAWDALQAELAAIREQAPVGYLHRQHIGSPQMNCVASLQYRGASTPVEDYAPVFLAPAPSQVAAEVVPGCVSISIDLLKDLRNAAPSDWKATIDCVLNGALLATSQGEA